MILLGMFLIAACFFLSGLNFAAWLQDRSRINNLTVAICVFLVGASNLGTLVGYVARM